MLIVALSENAREILRRRAVGEQVEATPDNLETYRELANAGAMVSVSTSDGGAEFRFRLTDHGLRLANASAAAEYLPHLTDQALRLLQSHLAAIGLRSGGTSGIPTEETREAYRELARAGLMGACHSFSRGPESVYRITEEAYNRRAELLAVQRRRFTPSAVARRILRAFSLIGRGVSAARSTTSS